jgi:hypothetical protein
MAGAGWSSSLWTASYPGVASRKRRSREELLWISRSTLEQTDHWDILLLKEILG